MHLIKVRNYLSESLSSGKVQRVFFFSEIRLHSRCILTMQVGVATFRIDGKNVTAACAVTLNIIRS